MQPVLCVKVTCPERIQTLWHIEWMAPMKSFPKEQGGSNGLFIQVAATFKFKQKKLALKLSLCKNNYFHDAQFCKQQINTEKNNVYLATTSRACLQMYLPQPLFFYTTKTWKKPILRHFRIADM